MDGEEGMGRWGEDKNPEVRLSPSIIINKSCATVARYAKATAAALIDNTVTRSINYFIRASSRD